MSYEQYEAKMNELRSLIKDPTTTNQQLFVQVLNIHKWMDSSGFNGDRLNTDFIIYLATEMRALYSHMHSFTTKEALLDAYHNNLSDRTRRIFSESEILEDWSNPSKLMYFVNQDINFNLIKCKISESESVFMGETEVTQELFLAVMGWMDRLHFPFQPPKKESHELDQLNKLKRTADNPIYYVTWYDCISFCNKLSNLLGLEECYDIEVVTRGPGNNMYGGGYEHIVDANVAFDKDKNGFRLPTDDEWVSCAKAGSNNRWSGTNKQEDLRLFAWYEENSKHKTHPVGELQPNAWGLYDMSGNVREWCWDLYDPDNNRYPTRVVLGGSYKSSAGDCMNLHAIGILPEHTLPDVGFRVCRSGN